MTDFIAIIIHIFPERVGDNCWLSVHWAAAVVHDPKKTKRETRFNGVSRFFCAVRLRRINNQKQTLLAQQLGFVFAQ